jgi:HK97 family phage prohead protease
MPILKPSPGESQDDFMGRCMGDDKMASEFPNRGQRAAVCLSSYQEGSKMSEAVESMNEDEAVEEFNTKFLHFDLKAYHDDDDEEEKGRFSGYGSIFGNKDLGNDVVEAGAFAKSLRKRKPKEVKLLWQHKQDMPIGVFDKISEDGDGLAVQGRLALGTQMGRDAYELMKMGALDGLSIGYKADPSKQDYDSRRRRRMLKEVDLLEISLVTFPMNPKARVSAVKGEDWTIREWERFFRDEASLSHSESKACAKAIITTLTKQRDAGESDSEVVALLGNLASIIQPTSSD